MVDTQVLFVKVKRSMPFLVVLFYAALVFKEVGQALRSEQSTPGPAPETTDGINAWWLDHAYPDDYDVVFDGMDSLPPSTSDEAREQMDRVQAWQWRFWTPLPEFIRHRYASTTVQHTKLDWDLLTGQDRVDGFFGGGRKPLETLTLSLGDSAYGMTPNEIVGKTVTIVLDTNKVQPLVPDSAMPTRPERPGRSFLFRGCKVDLDLEGATTARDTLVFVNCVVDAYGWGEDVTAALAFVDCPIVLFDSEGSRYSAPAAFVNNAAAFFSISSCTFSSFESIGLAPLEWSLIESTFNERMIMENPWSEPEFTDCWFKKGMHIRSRSQGPWPLLRECRIADTLAFQEGWDPAVGIGSASRSQSATVDTFRITDCAFAPNAVIAATDADQLIALVNGSCLSAMNLADAQLIALPTLDVWGVSHLSDSVGADLRGWEVAQSIAEKALKRLHAFADKDPSYQSAVVRVEATREEAKYRYYKARVRAKGTTWKECYHFLKGWVLKHTVNFGHSGEETFLLFSGALVVLFALLYWWWNDPTLGTIGFDKDHLPAILQYAPAPLRSLYASIWIFVAIKPPSAIFAVPRWLMLLAMLEWLSGILMAVLFFLYLAPNYPVFQKLFG